MNKEKDYIELPAELEALVGEATQKHCREMLKILSEKIKEIVWETADEYIEKWAGHEPQSNFIDQVREEVVRTGNLWSRKKEDYWGKSIRANIYNEHKEELLPLIQNDLIAAQQAKIELLEKDLAYVRERLNSMWRA